VQFGPTSSLRIFEFAGKGHGILTDRKLFKGQFVCEYAGEVIGSEEAVARRNSDKSHNYIFSLNEHVNDLLNETIVDATRIGNIGRYVNHSCDPNCRIVPVRIDSVIPKLAIFASRDIDPNEEVTYSYGNGNASESKKGEFKVCLCGSTSCKKFLPCDV
jgi:histone-lysine N-methyltransferase SETMAR